MQVVLTCAPCVGASALHAHQRSLRAVRAGGAGQLARKTHVPYVQRTLTSLGFTARAEFRGAPQVAGSALFWSNVDGAGLPEPLSVHEALPARGEGVRKAAINVWVRGEAWDTPTTRLRILLKQLVPWCFPAAEVAQTFCPNCGQYIGSEASFRDKRLHSRRCPIHTMSFRRPH